MSVHHFRRAHLRCWGTLHVLPVEGGFEVSHESESGSSWGNVHGPFDAADAIAAAHRLNREEYDDRAYVSICPQAMAAAYPCDEPRTQPAFGEWEF